jgi:hypothetical protein
MSMTDATTVPPPTPTDKLLGWVILAVTLLGVLATFGTVYLATQDLDTPTVLELVIGQAITGLVALLAGRRP